MNTTTTKNQNTELIKALFTNICHDMAGVIGAINNASELIEIEDNNQCNQSNKEVKQQALNLTKKSAQNAAYRIKMFRKAYALDDCFADTNLHDYCNDLVMFLAGKNINLILPVDSKQRYYKAYVSRIILNMLLVLSSAIPGKESIKLQIKKHNESIFVNAICATHNTIKIDDLIVDALMGKHSNINIKTAQAIFLHNLANEHDCELRISAGDKALEFNALFGQGHYS
ncbi:histidine phosphotransferase ChpT [Candidatus Xenohaliotis californiensis]|uniref:Histidine phosphotransferase ChpT n=1 Tax=Candidatus Xenohaliotis californiensis TaxID=84677 RepID=A0ABP0ETF8_9RICK|nr:histidine phosphotransferase ChpT [Candidatus Xenohaliotis californiensis]